MVNFPIKRMSVANGDGIANDDEADGGVEAPPWLKPPN